MVFTMQNSKHEDQSLDDVTVKYSYEIQMYGKGFSSVQKRKTNPLYGFEFFAVVPLYQQYFNHLSITFHFRYLF